MLQHMHSTIEQENGSMAMEGGDARRPLVGAVVRAVVEAAAGVELPRHRVAGWTTAAQRGGRRDGAGVCIDRGFDMNTPKQCVGR